MAELIKPDLSKDTTGPFVTRDGRKAEYAGPSIHVSVFRHTFRIDGEGFFQVADDGSFINGADQALDIFLAPKEPRHWFLNVYASGGGSNFYTTKGAANESAHHDRLALLQLEVDDQGVPVDGSVVRRVAL